MEVARGSLAPPWRSEMSLSAGCEQSREPRARAREEAKGPKQREAEKGAPLQAMGNPDLPQTLGPPAYAPYPSPVLSEEEDLLLDSPALEVSDSESDEVLVAGPEGRGSEAGMWEPMGWGGLQLLVGVRGGVKGTMSAQAPTVYTPALRALSRSAICWLCCLGQLRLPLCALGSYLYNGAKTLIVSIPGGWECSGDCKCQRDSNAWHRVST